MSEEKLKLNLFQKIVDVKRTSKALLKTLKVTTTTM